MEILRLTGHDGWNLKAFPTNPSSSGMSPPWQWLTKMNFKIFITYAPLVLHKPLAHHWSPHNQHAEMWLLFSPDIFARVALFPQSHAPASSMLSTAPYCIRASETPKQPLSVATCNESSFTWNHGVERCWEPLLWYASTVPTDYRIFH